MPPIESLCSSISHGVTATVTRGLGEANNALLTSAFLFNSVKSVLLCSVRISHGRNKSQKHYSSTYPYLLYIGILTSSISVAATAAYLLLMYLLYFGSRYCCCCCCAFLFLHRRDRLHFVHLGATARDVFVVHVPTAALHFSVPSTSMHTLPRRSIPFIGHKVHKRQIMYVREEQSCSCFTSSLPDGVSTPLGTCLACLHFIGCGVATICLLISHSPFVFRPRDPSEWAGL